MQTLIFANAINCAVEDHVAQTFGIGGILFANFAIRAALRDAGSNQSRRALCLTRERFERNVFAVKRAFLIARITFHAGNKITRSGKWLISWNALTDTRNIYIYIPGTGEYYIISAGYIPGARFYEATNDK